MRCFDRSRPTQGDWLARTVFPMALINTRTHTVSPLLAKHLEEERACYEQYYLLLEPRAAM